jgi:hypothetical protein
VSRIKHQLKELTKAIVLVPVDKAVNNGMSIFYTRRLSTPEFVKIHLFLRQISSTLPLSDTSPHRHIPNMYWVFTLHEQPFKFRFIPSSSKCSTTICSALITSALTTNKQLIINFNFHIFLELIKITFCL